MVNLAPPKPPRTSRSMEYAHRGWNRVPETFGNQPEQWIGFLLADHPCTALAGRNCDHWRWMTRFDLVWCSWVYEVSDKGDEQLERSRDHRYSNKIHLETSQTIQTSLELLLIALIIEIWENIGDFWSKVFRCFLRFEDLKNYDWHIWVIYLPESRYISRPRTLKNRFRNSEKLIIKTSAHTSDEILDVIDLW